MDDYFFEGHVRACTEVEENTSFLEIFNYSNGECYYDKGVLPMSEFDNFLESKGVFEPPKNKPGVHLVSGMRLVLQLGAKHPDTFTTQHISFTHTQYIDMVRKLRLPFRAVEGSSVVGPFFWSGLDVPEDPTVDAFENRDPHLQVVFRKSDVLKKGLTRGWELMLSHSFRTGITTGYAKGTESSNLDKTIDIHLQTCKAQVGHPLLLPTIILGHDLDTTMDDRQRKARHELRRLEHAITDRNEIQEHEGYSKFDLDEINRLLVECHSQVLWKRPQAFVDTIDEIEKAMVRFRDERARLLAMMPAALPPHLASREVTIALHKLHRCMENRFDFFRQKLKGIHHYAQTTLARLDIQRGALYNIIAQKESKLNLEMAHHQRLLALASKRDSQSMKALSVVGATFLPATYLASVFSMTFFNFQNGGGNASNASSNNSNDDEPAVAPTLWIYFALTIPITLVVLGLLFWWDKKREKEFADEEKAIETQLPLLEQRVVSNLREKKTGFTSLDTKRWDTM